VSLKYEPSSEPLQVDLDAFTAMPRPDDILLYALPVCAPYFALQAYKYKVKSIAYSDNHGILDVVGACVPDRHQDRPHVFPG